jgi:transcription antitermination protein NusB
MTPGRRAGDLEPTEAESRRAARERALELLYEAEAKGATVADVLAGLPLAPDALARELAQGVETHRERIDEVLARLVAPRWSLARLASVDRAVLRIGAYELFEVPDRSQALIINEAVLLARRFGSDDSPRFVNGVLASVAAEARPEGVVPPAEAPGEGAAPAAGPSQGKAAPAEGAPGEGAPPDDATDDAPPTPPPSVGG